MIPQSAIIEALKDQIRGWFRAGQGIVITPTNSLMEHVLISPTPQQREIGFRGYVDLSRFTDVWINALSYSLQSVEFDLSEVFIRLLGLEAGLQWKGVLQKKATFITNPRLFKLRQLIPSLKVNEKIVNTFNHNRELLHKINQVKPSKIEVKLVSTLYYLGNLPHLDDDADLQLLVDYVQDPDEIFWEIDVYTSLQRWDQTIDSNKTTRLLEAMNLMAKDVISVCRSTISELK